MDKQPARFVTIIIECAFFVFEFFIFTIIRQQSKCNKKKRLSFSIKKNNISMAFTFILAFQYEYAEKSQILLLECGEREINRKYEF